MSFNPTIESVSSPDRRIGPHPQQREHVDQPFGPGPLLGGQGRPASWQSGKLRNREATTPWSRNHDSSAGRSTSMVKDIRHLHSGSDAR
jgi:hypothetical protein